MKKIFLFISFFLILVLHPASSQIVTQNNAFVTGEEFVLDAYYHLGFMWFKVGTAVFSVSEENGNYLFTVTCNNYPQWNWLYEVKTKHVASCTKDMKPIYMWCDVVENGKHHTDSYKYKVYDDRYEIHRVLKSEKYPNTLDTIFSMPLEAHDIINSIYVARNADLTVNNGKMIPFYPIFGNKIHMMYGNVLGKKDIVTREGDKYRCTKNTAVVGGGTIVDNSEPVYVYVTDDERRIPVLVETKLSLGYVKVYLKNYSIKK